MSTTGNGHSGNGNGNKPIVEAVSADSEVGSAVSGKIAPPPGQHEESGLRFRSGSALVSRLRRLRDSQQRAEGDA